MNVIHNTAQNRFEVALKGGALAELSYVLKPTTLTITHTYVPPAFEGRGVAGKLTEEALTYAAANGLEVVPSAHLRSGISSVRTAAPGHSLGTPGPNTTP